jgi:ATP-dependent Clp protease ATP-binding subunit ClpB
MVNFSSFRANARGTGAAGPAAAGGMRVSADRRRILVADIDPDYLVAIQKVLEDSGFDAYVTWDADEGLTLAESRRFDVLIIGNHPPEIDTRTILPCLRTHNIRIPCIEIESVHPSSVPHKLATLGVCSVVSRSEGASMSEEINKLLSPDAGQPIQVPLDPYLRSSVAREFEEHLRNKIVGQEDAIEAVTTVYQMLLAGLNPPNRPVGNLLFLGPTGSGKTHVVEIVAEALFGDRHAFTKVDCGEFQHSHEIAKLIGSPPGYIGHRETIAMLSQEALDRWQTESLKLSLLLFDEIEKASDALWQLLLGILDKASLTLGDNRRVDLSRCLIFMTSNLGATEMSRAIEGGMGFARAEGVEPALDEKITRVAEDAARRKFSPEFMNRLDKVVVFKTLRPEHMERILELELAAVQVRISSTMGENRFTFRCTPAVKQWLLAEGTDPKYGARHLKRAIERHLVFPIANLVATNQVASGDSIEVDLRADGTLAFTKVAVASAELTAAGRVA